MKCAVACAAPYQALLSFSQMLNFSKFDPGLAFTVLDSLTNHSWYLSAEWVIVCLADKDCPVKERRAVARAVYKTPCPDNFEPRKPDLPGDFWPKTGKMPSLSSFVGPRSWLLPHLLGMGPEEMEWLKLEVHQWHLTSGFKAFAAFIEKMLVVNDPAERGVKLVQDFVNTTQDEELRQWRMLSAADQRKKYSKNMTKKQMKEMNTKASGQ